MELTTPLLSSAVRYLTLAETANAFFPDVIAQIQERYRFWEVPKGPDELNFETGAKFNAGRFKDTTIRTFQIFNNGVLAQAEATTSTIDSFVGDLLEWTEKTFAFSYKPLQPVEKIFVSQLEVQASGEFSKRFNSLSLVRNKLSEMVAGYGISADPYAVAGITLETIQSEPIRPGRFVFERRAGVPHKSNLFYSSAPVSTDQHLELLADLENSL